MAEEKVLSSSSSTNREYADNFFKEIFRKESSIKELLNFIGVKENDKKIEIRILEPVLIGNRQNDLSFLWNGIFYYFLEHQSTWNKNMPLRFLFYVCQGLERYVTGEDLYKKKGITIPEVKCYTIFTGIGTKEVERLETEQRLSESYLSKEKNGTDLELCVHCFHMEVTKEEMKQFLEKERIPERFGTMENMVVQYAMFVNMVRYGIGKYGTAIDTQQAKQIVVETCEWFLKRGYLTEFLTRREVINMALEQLSREEILLIEGREEGREVGREEGREEGREVGRAEEKVQFVERMAEELGSIEVACKLLGVEVEEYYSCKEFLETFSFL